MKTLTWKGIRVPYINSWTAESVPQPPIMRIQGRRGEGIGYENEDEVTDRRHEALWIRSGLAQGRGEPDFHCLNTHRQQRAMRYSLCQVCGETVIGCLPQEHTLRLMAGDTPIAEGETTAAPPVHPLCAVEAIENCPPLRRSHAMALVKYSLLWGVAGIVHDSVTLAPLPNPGKRPGELQHVSIGDKTIRWTLANFSVDSLHGVKPVSLDELRAMEAKDIHRTAAGDQADQSGREALDQPNQ